VETIANLAGGFAIALTPINLLWALVGCFLGTAIGVLPGIGPALTIALLLPVTYQISATGAFILFCGTFYGAMYGGSTTSILINTPGESGSIITSLEGNRMARSGRAGPALATAAIGSFIAGTIGTIGISFLGPVVVELALGLGPAEYFSLMVLGLVSSIALAHGSIVKALAAYLRAKVSGLSPWDRYEMGQTNAVSADARAGYDLFMGKARCVACHTPPLYMDGNFHNIGLEAGKAKPDPGRGNVTKKPEDASAFKTPTLRSVAISGPYFHDGSRATLEQAVRYMASGGGADPNKSAVLVDTKLTDREVQQLVAFLTSLTSDEPYTAPKIP